MHLVCLRIGNGEWELSPPSKTKVPCVVKKLTEEGFWSPSLKVGYKGRVNMWRGLFSLNFEGGFPFAYSRKYSFIFICHMHSSSSQRVLEHMIESRQKELCNPCSMWTIYSPTHLTFPKRTTFLRIRGMVMSWCRVTGRRASIAWRGDPLGAGSCLPSLLGESIQRTQSSEQPYSLVGGSSIWVIWTDRERRGIQDHSSACVALLLWRGETGGIQEQSDPPISSSCREAL